MTIIQDRDNLPADPVVASSGTDLVIRARGTLVVPPPAELARRAAAQMVPASRATRRAAGRLAVRAGTTTEHAIGYAAPPIARAGWRFLAGRPLVGAARTNATFWRRGTTTATLAGRTGKWSHLRGIERAAIRLGVTSPALALLDHLEPLAVEVTSSSLVAIMCGYGGHRAVNAWTYRAHLRRYVYPLADVLTARIGAGPGALVTSWVHVPLAFHSGGHDVRIDLPAGFSGSTEDRRIVVETVTQKLGLDQSEAVFHLIGDRPHVIFRLPRRPPDRIGFAEVTELMAQRPDTAPLVGIGQAGAVIVADLNADSPHVLISAGSGAGKSVLIRTLLSQGLHNGGQGIILDVKRVSHAWAKGLPNVRYCRDIQDIHDTLISLRDHIDDRYNLIDDGADIDGNTDHIDIGPRMFLVAEEMNATINRLQKYWRLIKDKDDPTQSPAVDALGDILFMGRQGKCHVFAVAQMATARSLGGPEQRENFGTRLLSRYTMNAWRMLVPEVWPMPRSKRHPGRWQAVVAGVARETQVVFMEAREARDYAVAGTVVSLANGWVVPDPAESAPEPTADRVTASQGHSTPTDQGNGTCDVTADQPSLSLVGDGGDRPVGLADAIAAGTLTVSLTVARAARARDSEFPPARGRRGQELLYSPTELTRWEHNRERATAAENG